MEGNKEVTQEEQKQEGEAAANGEQPPAGENVKTPGSVSGGESGDSKKNRPLKSSKSAI